MGSPLKFFFHFCLKWKKQLFLVFWEAFHKKVWKDILKSSNKYLSTIEPFQLWKHTLVLASDVFQLGRSAHDDVLVRPLLLLSCWLSSFSMLNTQQQSLRLVSSSYAVLAFFAVLACKHYRQQSQAKKIRGGRNSCIQEFEIPMKSSFSLLSIICFQINVYHSHTLLSRSKLRTADGNFFITSKFKFIYFALWRKSTDFS